MKRKRLKKIVLRKLARLEAKFPAAASPFWSRREVIPRFTPHQLEWAKAMAEAARANFEEAKL